MPENDVESKSEHAPELSGLDLHCIARHIREYVERVMKEDAQALNACDGCGYLYQCTGVPNALDPWPSFGKLSKLTGVPIDSFLSKDQRERLRVTRDAQEHSP